jgi:streptogramin lyase
MNTTQSKTHVPAKASTLQMMARLAALALLAALLVPSASAQSLYIYVANTAENTVSKIDINANVEVARYYTWFPAGFGPAPSRVVQDAAKNVFVLDRFFPAGSTSTNAHLPVLLKIAPAGSGTTSSGAGLTAALPMTDNGTMPNKIDPGDTKDTRILWGNEIGNAGDEGALGRALCIDPSGVLWVGLHNVGTTGKGKYYRVDASTGAILPPLAGVPVPNGHNPYGCQVAANGKLWSVSGNHIVEIDTTLPTYPATLRDHSTTPDFGQNYSLSLFNGCGTEPTKVYLSERRLKRTYIAYDPQAPPATAFSNAPAGTVPQFESIAIAVDLMGDIVSGEWRTGRVIKTNRFGNLLWDSGTPLPSSTGSTGDLHGLIIDENNDIWAVHSDKNRVVKYDSGGMNKQNPVEVKVGRQPYTYGNPPPPTCPCAQTAEPQITCKGKNREGQWEYSWSFQVTNHSPFTAAATTINIDPPTGSPITGLTPRQFTFPNPLNQNGQAIVSGTFTLAQQPAPGTKICFDIRLNAGVGWCCPIEHVCFTVPDCSCASLQSVFKCAQGRPYLELSVTNLGPTAAAGVQVFSNTAGVMVTPSMTMQNFPQNTAVPISLIVTGGTPGQVINLTVNVHGPVDDRTGVFSWCCMANIKVTYPSFLCPWLPDGWIFDDINANGVRDSGEGALPEWTVTLTDGKGKAHTTKTDASGKYQFEEIEPGKSRLSVQPPQGWRATAPKGGAFSLTVEAPPKGPLDFGFVKTR